MTCGPWWSQPRPTIVADPPVKEEFIYLDSNPGWYQDPRKVSFCLFDINSFRFVHSSSTPIMSQPQNYYTYKSPWPATINDGRTISYSSPSDWPRTYRVNPNYRQGLHPPGQAQPTWNYGGYGYNQQYPYGYNQYSGYGQGFQGYGQGYGQQYGYNGGYNMQQWWPNYAQYMQQYTGQVSDHLLNDKTDK